MNDVGSKSDRWALARRLFEMFGTSEDELATLMGLDKAELSARIDAEHWQFATDAAFDASDGNLHETESAQYDEVTQDGSNTDNLKDGQHVRGAAAQTRKISRQTIGHLQRQLDALALDEDLTFSEMRTKNLLTITKGIQALEDMIKRMDVAAHDATQTPRDIVEIRQKLERQIAVLSDPPA